MNKKKNIETEAVLKPKPKPKKKKYSVQNSKILTINFSAIRFVQKAKILIPDLKRRVDLRSRGLTILMAIEYCSQERVIKDFMAFVNTKRRSLVQKG